MTEMSRRWAELAAAGIWRPSQRLRLLRWAGARLGRVRIYPGIRFIGDPRGFRAGDECFVNVELLVGGGADVTLGERVSIGPRCALLPGTHEPGTAAQRAGAVAVAPITIGDGCWIGAGTTVLSGVSIGAGAVIAAGAVVTSDCEPHCLYAGVPARLVRRLDEG